MNLLALDLGTHTGWAALVSAGRGSTFSSGVWHFESGRYEGGGMRYLRFRAQLLEALELVKPEAVVFEEVRRHAGTSAAHVYGGLLGMLTATCEERKVPYQGVPVGTIKRHATGKGNADKPAMIAAAAKRWGVTPEDDNHADALCILAWAQDQYPAMDTATQR